jgi:hypothetical protein
MSNRQDLLLVMNSEFEEPNLAHLATAESSTALTSFPASI